MPYAKGQSGNPKGRPPKPRALTAILEKAGSRSVTVQGRKISGKRLAAQMAWEVATTGKVTFPDGSILAADLEQWLSVLKWIYTQVDGPAPSTQNVKVGNQDGESFMIGVRAVDYRTGLGSLAPVNTDQPDGE